LQRAEKAAKATSPPSNPLLKRKRSNVDESEPKLKEFLEIMRPKSKSKTWGTEDMQAQDVEEPPRKVQAMELPEAESDNEYEMVPKKSKKEQSVVVSKEQPIPVQIASSPVFVPTDAGEPSESVQTETPDAQPEPVGGVDATDDDWLRSRTNRLLDLVDPTDAVAQKALNIGSQPSPRPKEPVAHEDVDIPVDQEIIAEEVVEEEVPSDSLDPTVEAIRASGRLFVRNLPYSATEEDLRRHFEAYGNLEEVIIFQWCVCCLLLHDEYPDRDILCF
jgi:multiple RNA-binding domain-containing protein 1